MRTNTSHKVGKSGYELSRQWFDFVFQASEPVTPIHTALYFWILELNNRLHWKEVIGLPTNYSMEAIGLKSYRSYKRCLDDLIKWGFIDLHSKSFNQHTSNQIALVLKTKAETKATAIALDLKAKAEPKQRQKQSSDNKTIKTIKTVKTFFEDKKIDLLFKEFIDETKIESPARINSLIHLLKTLGDDNPKYMGEIITKAIAGGYKSFIALTDAEKANISLKSYKQAASPEQSLSDTKTEAITTLPTEEELRKFFEKKGLPLNRVTNAFAGLKMSSVSQHFDWQAAVLKQYEHAQ